MFGLTIYTLAKKGFNIEGRELLLDSISREINNVIHSINRFIRLKIASTNDRILNITFGKALKEAGLIEDFEPEVKFGLGLKRRTDLVCETESGEIRMVFMWRKNTSQAEIANYTLTKLYNYGKAIGFFEKNLI